MSYAVVTPSYGPDFERCALLCRSVAEHLDGDFRHYLVVDARDRARFGALAGARTEILTVEAVMPWWLRRVPGARRWWFSLKTPPVRNWILQQLVKLSAAEYLSEEQLVFIDSDVAFIRPFHVDGLSPHGRLRLFRVPGVANQMPHNLWHRTAARLLGLPPRDYFGSTYIGNLITWRRANLQALYRRIEATTGRSWLAAVAAQWHLSEYILYGIFAEHVLGAASEHEYTDLPLCHISWDYTIHSDEDVDGFFGALRPHHVAVMMSSKQRVDVSRYAHHFAPATAGTRLD